MNHDVAQERQQSHGLSAEESSESASRPKKKRSFLRIPSRSSSNKKQKEPSSSPEDQSQGNPAGSSSSLGNTTAKRRNSKASSKRSRDTQHASDARVQVDPKAATREVDSNPDAESKPKGPSKFWSFLSCCGSSGDDNDDSPLPPKESTKSQSIRTRQASIEKPETGGPEPVDPDAKDPRALNENVNSNAFAEQSTSKAEHHVDVPTETAANKVEMQQQSKAGASTSSHIPNQDEISQPAPIVAVEEPEKSQPLPVDIPSNDPIAADNMDTSVNKHQTQLESVSEQPDEKEDTVMRDDPAPVEEEAIAETQHESIQQQTPIPPPPPLSQPIDAQLPPIPSMQPDKQKWLLPPIEPHFQNRKCLVLDLDETLVHSSFKVLPYFLYNNATLSLTL